MSPKDIADKALSFANGSFKPSGDKAEDLKESRKWAHEFLTHSGAMEFANANYDQNHIGRVIATRGWEIREMYEEDRLPLWFLDMFRDRNLITPIQPGERGHFSGITRNFGGDIRYIGDKTDDWPTSGGIDREYRANNYKYFAGSVEVGLLEQWEASRSGKDLFEERLNLKLRDIDEFNDSAISVGAPLHGIHGFIMHPDIPNLTVPPGISTLTDWPNKTPAEIRFDIQLAMETVRTGSLHNSVANMLMLSDLRYTYLSTLSVTPEGRSFMSMLAQDFDTLPWANSDIIQPFVPFDTAAAGNTGT